MSIFLVTFVVMLIVVFIMAIGVMFGRRAIKGSCGGGMNKAECVCALAAWCTTYQYQHG